MDGGIGGRRRTGETNFEPKQANNQSQECNHDPASPGRGSRHVCSTYMASTSSHSISLWRTFTEDWIRGYNIIDYVIAEHCNLVKKT